MERKQLIESFIKENIGDGFEIKLISHNSFSKNYYRVTNGKDSYILMDDFLSKYNQSNYSDITSFLTKNNFSCPKIIASNLSERLFIISDFGDNSFKKLLAQDNKICDERILYERAIDVLISLHKLDFNKHDFCFYDSSMMVNDSKKFIEWYVNVHNGYELKENLQNDFESILSMIFNQINNSKQVVSLSNYNSSNLFWLEDYVGLQKIGLINYHEAVISSPIYDVVSLLEDAKRDLSEEIVMLCINRYLNAFPKYSRKDFLAEYNILSLQRNLKIIGLFSQQSVNFKKNEFLQYLPRVWGYIHKSLNHPVALPLKKWLSLALTVQEHDSRLKSKILIS